MADFFGAEDILSTRTETDAPQPVILTGVWKTTDREYLSETDFFHSMEELAELARACHMEPLCYLTQQLPRVDQALYIRRGKAEELAEMVKNMEAERVVFNDTLSPSQIRNLQKMLRVPVVDRTRLILEIFETRARTREAKLQVELAKLQYLKPRLIGLWETQNRQGGASGSMSTRGEGEKQLEIDRRTIDHRLTELRRELTLVGTERETQRKRRSRSHLPVAALVGYTNAGKSTIMNAMIDRWASDPSADEKKVFEADMLFATLDTSVRKIKIERGREFLLSDTVGFIHALPTALVEAFHSTLEEVAQADLLLQVVDGSDPHYREQMKATRETILSLGAGHIPMITVFNKSDLREPAIEYPRRGLREESIDGETNENIYISAKETSSIEMLAGIILEKLEDRHVTRELLIPYSRGDVQAYVSGHSRVLSSDYREEGVLMTLRCDPVIAARAEKMLSGDRGRGSVS